MKYRLRFDPKLPHNGVLVITVELIHRYRHQTLPMVFDTGAAYTCLPSSVVGYLNPTPAGTQQILGLITSQVGRYVIDEVNINGVLVARDVVVLAYDLVGPVYAKGLLGLSFLKHFPFFVDFQRGVIEFHY